MSSISNVVRDSVLKREEDPVEKFATVTQSVGSLLALRAIRVIDRADFRQKINEIRSERLIVSSQPVIRRSGSWIERDIEEDQDALRETVDELLKNPFTVSTEKSLRYLDEAVELDDGVSAESIAVKTNIDGRNLERVFLTAKEKEKWNVVIALIRSKKLLPGFVSQFFNECCKNRNLNLLSKLVNIPIPEGAFKRQFEVSAKDEALRAVLIQFIQLR